MESVELPQDLKNPRQLFGREYVNRYPDEDIDPEKEVSYKGDEFSCRLKGKTGNPPEMDKIALNEGVSVIVVYYTLDQFLVTGNSGKNLDLVSVTPEGWKQKSVSMTTPEIRAPELHMAIGHYQNLDMENNECVVSNSAGEDSPENIDKIIKIGLWNTLVARFVSEVGEPFNREGVEGMRNSILQRRGEIFDALNGNSDGDPINIALRSFANAPKQ